MARKKYEDDDGRQIADMSGLDSALTGRSGRSARKSRAAGRRWQPPVPAEPEGNIRLTVRMLLAALSSAAYSSRAFLFILFSCVWFRDRAAGPPFDRAFRNHTGITRERQHINMVPNHKAGLAPAASSVICVYRADGASKSGPTVWIIADRLSGVMLSAGACSRHPFTM